jgi:hypothetical protein
MTDPTPEERGIIIAVDAERIYETFSGREPDGYDAALAEHAADEIRAAVWAEREACAEVDPTGIVCVACGCAVDEFCFKTDDGIWLFCHHERWRAAIRARGESE